jgi:putative endonuclease
VLSSLRRLIGWKDTPSEPQKNSQPQTAKARTGAEGEEAAAEYLRRLGWKILDRNWRSRHLELDIVAEERDTVVFVEVKTRAEGGLQSPFEALIPTKKERLCRAAQAWLEAHEAWSRPCRFDLVCVTSRAGTYQTELIRNVIEYGEQGSRNALGGRNSSWQPW